MKAYKYLLKFSNKRIYRFWQNYKKTEWLDSKELKELQFKKLKDILSYAYINFSFYQKKFDQAGVKPDDFQRLKDIEKFPFTKISELKEALKNGEFKNYKKEPINYLATTGSTGTPFIFPINQSAQEERAACAWRTAEWYGGQFSARHLRLWRTEKKGLKQKFKDKFIFNTKELSVYDANNPGESLIDELKLAYFVSEIKKYRPTVIDSYVSALTLLADYILKNQIKNLGAEIITSGAEYLSPYARKLIEKAFECKVLNRYGGTETSLIAHQCKQANEEELHIMADKLLLELVRDGQVVVPGGWGEVVITDFTNRAMPFIRLQIGDIAVSADPGKQCTCGRSLPLLKSVEGRINDLFSLPNGKILVSHVWHKLFREIKEIESFQIIQKQKDYFQVLIVLENKNYDLVELKNRVQKFLPKCQVEWLIVDKIYPGVGGKFRHSISEVPLVLNEIRSCFVAPARNIANIAPYILPQDNLAFNDRAQSLKLDWNEGVINPAPAVAAKLTKILQSSNWLNWYPDLDQDKIKKSIAEFTKTKKENIEIFNGSDNALDYLAKTFIEADDRAAIISPTYDQFRVSLEAMGGICDYIFGQDPFNLKIDELIHKINKNNKLIYLVNPNNPTGFLFTKADIQKLAQAFPNSLIILDEAYIEFCPGKSAASLLDKNTNLIILRSFSKAFCLAGLRIGYLIAHPHYLNLIRRIKNFKEVNALALLAAEESLNNLAYYKKYIEEVLAAKKYFKEELKQLGIEAYGDGGNFVILKLAHPQDLIKFLANKQIYIRDRSYLPQLDNYVRISIGTKAQMQKILSLIKEFLSL